MIKKLSLIFCAVMLLTVCAPILADSGAIGQDPSCSHPRIEEYFRLVYREISDTKHSVIESHETKCLDCLTIWLMPGFNTYEENHDFIINDIGCYDMRHTFEVVCSKCSFNQRNVYSCEGVPHVSGPVIINGIICW